LSVPEGGKLPKKKGKPPLGWIIGGVIAGLFALSVIIGFIWYMVQPPVTPTPTLVPSSTPTIAATNIPYTPTLKPPSTPTPRPTIGATYTPWPTNTPDPTSTP
jgi:hypothetical protein